MDERCDEHLGIPISHRLGTESNEHPGAKGRAPRRSQDSQLPDLSRSFPIFPELRPILDEAFEIFGDKSDYVVAAPQYRAAANTAMGWKNANLRSEMTRLLRRAGVSGWPRLFHSMRASRQTELQREFPLHVVCSWLGNSPRIAQQSYLLVTEDDFAKAAGAKVVMVEG